MVLFIILALVFIFIAVFTIVAISAGGAVMIVVFGDVIVCGVLIIVVGKLVYTHFYKK